MIHNHSAFTRRRQSGGITILLALTLLAVMGSMAFGLSRNSLREIAITGNESTGRKAAEASEAGMDWGVMWMLGNGITTEQLAINAAVKNLVRAIDDPTQRVLGTDATLSVTGTGTLSPNGYLRSYIYPASSSSDMYLSTSGLSQTTSQARESFNLEVRYLGPNPLDNTSAITTSKASGGGATGAQRYFFLIRSIGRANIYTDPTNVSGTPLYSFVAQRECIVETPSINN